MKRIIIFAAVVLALILGSGFTMGQSTVKENRNKSGFTKVSFGVSGNMYISIGNEFKVTLEGDKDDLEDIITEVSSGRLVVKKENWRMNFNEKVNVYITMPELEGLGVSGSGKAEIKDAVKTDNLSLSVSGSGKLYTSEITVSDLKCSISGSGDIILGGGSASDADISISGSGNYSGETTKLGSVDISISGSGNCVVNVTGSLKAGVSGSGDVTYIGNPKVDARVSGSGKVRSR
jgi:hypothetical protein